MFLPQIICSASVLDLMPLFPPSFVRRASRPLNPEQEQVLQRKQNYSPLVASSGHFHAFHVVFVPLEYIPTIPPHSTYIIVLSYFSEVKTARYVLRKINKICIFSQNTKLFFTWFPSLKVWITMTNVERGGILWTYSSGTKPT